MDSLFSLIQRNGSRYPVGKHVHYQIGIGGVIRLEMHAEAMRTIYAFMYGDTLIRLFPQQFWFDSVVTVSSLSLLGGLLFYIVGRAISSKDIVIKPVT